MRYSRLLAGIVICSLLPSPSAAAGSRRRKAVASPPCRFEEVRCSGKENCLDTGCGRRVDTCLARKQERAGEAGQWILRHYSFDRFLSLNRVSISRSLPRQRLDPALLRKIDGLENSAGVVLEGYLLDVRRVRRDRSACGRSKIRSLEFLIGPTPTSEKTSAIRARLTPKILKDHPGWTLSRLRRWRSRGDHDGPRIRTRGYLLFNNLKAGEVSMGLRPTAWEVSPVMEVLFCPSEWRCGQSDEDGWLELDTLCPSVASGSP